MKYYVPIVHIVPRDIVLCMFCCLLSIFLLSFKAKAMESETTREELEALAESRKKEVTHRTTMSLRHNDMGNNDIVEVYSSDGEPATQENILSTIKGRVGEGLRGKFKYSAALMLVEPSAEAKAILSSCLNDPEKKNHYARHLSTILRIGYGEEFVIYANAFLESPEFDLRDKLDFVNSLLKWDMPMGIVVPQNLLMSGLYDSPKFSYNQKAVFEILEKMGTESIVLNGVHGPFTAVDVARDVFAKNKELRNALRRESWNRYVCNEEVISVPLLMEKALIRMEEVESQLDALRLLGNDETDRIGWTTNESPVFAPKIMSSEDVEQSGDIGRNTNNSSVIDTNVVRVSMADISMPHAKESGLEHCRQIMLAAHIYKAVNEKYPSSLVDLYDSGKGILSDIKIFQSPTYEYSEQYREDYVLRDIGGEADLQGSDKVVLWDKPDNWPDGGHIGYGGSVCRFVEATPEEWRKLTDALASKTDKELVLKHIPDADVSDFNENDSDPPPPSQTVEE